MNLHQTASSFEYACMSQIEYEYIDVNSVGEVESSIKDTNQPPQKLIKRISPHRSRCDHVITLQRLFDSVVKCSVYASLTIKSICFTFRTF